MDPECLFTVEDIMEGTWQDRPKVVECLYQLLRKAEQVSIPESVSSLHAFTCALFRSSTKVQVLMEMRFSDMRATAPKSLIELTHLRNIPK